MFALYFNVCSQKHPHWLISVFKWTQLKFTSASRSFLLRFLLINILREELLLFFTFFLVRKTKQVVHIDIFSCFCCQNKLLVCDSITTCEPGSKYKLLVFYSNCHQIKNKIKYRLTDCVIVSQEVNDGREADWAHLMIKLTTVQHLFQGQTGQSLKVEQNTIRGSEADDHLVFI